MKWESFSIPGVVTFPEFLTCYASFEFLIEYPKIKFASRSLAKLALEQRLKNTPLGELLYEKEI